ncbi:MAG: Mut7-C RNAse domain-containing protein [Myxococcota bacterium]
MATVRFTLHGDLSDFTRPATGLAAGPSPVTVTARFEGRASLKDVLESVGVPHPEVDLVLCGSRPLTLESPTPADARVDVFPVGAGPSGHARLVPTSQETPRFLLDGHLGRLASLLRMLGFDTRWERDADDAALAEASAREDRILLTRDLGLLKRSAVRRGAFVRGVKHLEQGREVVRRFQLRSVARPFTRCIRCNTPLRDISAAEAAPRVPPRVRERHRRFLACDGCDALYWPGTHHDAMKGVVASLCGAPPEAGGPGDR